MIYLMRTKERMEKSAARHKIQSNMAKRVLLYGIRKEYSLKELPAIGKGIYGKPYFPEYPEICFNYSHADAGILCGIAETPLGVDIERLIHPTERLIRAVCHVTRNRRSCRADQIFQQNLDGKRKLSEMHRNRHPAEAFESGSFRSTRWKDL